MLAMLKPLQREVTKVSPYDDDSARGVIAAAREWQENAELAIPAEIVEDLIGELEARLRRRGKGLLGDNCRPCSACGDGDKAVEYHTHDTGTDDIA